jgi:hypothetical protein
VIALGAVLLLGILQGILLAHSIREGEGCGSETQPIGRVCGCGLRDNWNALAVEEKGSGGGRRLHHGPRVVMAPVMAASMAV